MPGSRRTTGAITRGTGSAIVFAITGATACGAGIFLNAKRRLATFGPTFNKERLHK
jgi:hypothetical protein